MTVLHIVVAMKPIEGNYAENAISNGVAGLNIDGSRIGTSVIKTGFRKSASSASMVTPLHGGSDPRTEHHVGRWPANLIHDGSDEVKAEFPHTVSNGRNGDSGSGKQTGLFGMGSSRQDTYFDSGSASRFFKECKD